MTVLEGKVALITGVSAGLGATTAQLFAQRGASVFGIARDAEKMAKVFADVRGGRYASVDVITSAACQQAVADCVAAFGRLDVLVNVAGYPPDAPHARPCSDADWERDLAVNLNGPFFLCRAALPHLLETGGNIVNVASIAGVEGEVYSAGYCAAKHGLVGLTRALAVEFTKDEAARERGLPGRHAHRPGHRVRSTRGRGLGPHHAHRIAPRSSWTPPTSPSPSRSWPVTTRRRSMVR